MGRKKKKKERSPRRRRLPRGRGRKANVEEEKKTLPLLGEANDLIPRVESPASAVGPAPPPHKKKKESIVVALIKEKRARTGPRLRLSFHVFEGERGGGGRNLRISL